MELTLDELSIPAMTERRKADPDAPFLPFETGKEKQVPDFLPIPFSTPTRSTDSMAGR